MNSLSVKPDKTTDNFLPGVAACADRHTERETSASSGTRGARTAALMRCRRTPAALLQSTWPSLLGSCWGEKIQFIQALLTVASDWKQIVCTQGRKRFLGIQKAKLWIHTERWVDFKRYPERKTQRGTDRLRMSFVRDSRAGQPRLQSSN